MTQAPRICVIGIGYVGLIQAVGLAHFGCEVVCIDTDARRIDELKRGVPPIFEEKLDGLLKETIASGRIRFSTRHADAAGCGLYFFAVGTPTSERTGGARLDYLEAAVRDAASSADDDAVFVVKSTVPIGTCRKLQEVLDRDHPQKRFAVVSNPEFLREGSALSDFFNPERIVIGGSSAEAKDLVRSVYGAFEQRGVPMVVADTTTAEAIKYAANAFLAMKVTFINEIADLMEVVGGDIDEVARGIGLDSRIGPQFLRTGPGYGGSCFPKDTLALATMGRRNGVQQRIIETVIRVNDDRRFRILQRIERTLHDQLAGKRVAVLGLAFKANTDDVRDSPAVDIVHALLEEGSEVRAYDPIARYDAGHASYRQCASIEAACEGASVVLCATEWPEFRDYDFSGLNDVVARRYIFDMRRIIDPASPALEGWLIDRIGSPSAAGEAGAVDVHQPEIEALRLTRRAS